MQIKKQTISFLIGALVFPSIISGISGGITQYGPGPGTGGACGFTKGIWPRQNGQGPAETMLAAINIPMWADGMNCGLCVSVKATKVNRPPVTVMVIDQCPPCDGTSLDLSMKAWREVTGIYDGAVGKEPVTWDFVPCPAAFTSGDMYYLLKEGSNAYALRVNPQNFPSKIKTIQIRWSGQDWKDMIKDPNTTGLYWKLEQVAPIPQGYELRSVFIDGSISGSSGPINVFDSAVVGNSRINSGGGNADFGNSTGAFAGPIPALRGSSLGTTDTNPSNNANPVDTTPSSDSNAPLMGSGSNLKAQPEESSPTSADPVNASPTDSNPLGTDSTKGNVVATGPLFTGSSELKPPSTPSEDPNNTIIGDGQISDSGILPENPVSNEVKSSSDASSLRNMNGLCRPKTN